MANLGSHARCRLRLHLVVDGIVDGRPRSWHVLARAPLWIQDLSVPLLLVQPNIAYILTLCRHALLWRLPRLVLLSSEVEFATMLSNTAVRVLEGLAHRRRIDA